MANNDLIKWVTSEVDFYELLGITFENCSESELRRAYRKTALKYHPDKVGKDFDPDKYELFQAANDVLSDPELKAKYDNHRNAKLLRKRADDLFEGKRRQMKDDLEARERGASTAGTKRSREEEEQKKDLKKLAEEGKRRRMAREMQLKANFKAEMPFPQSTPVKPVIRKDTPKQKTQAQAQVHQGEDEVERLERKIREAEAAKAERKAERRARKSGIFVPADSTPVATPEAAASKKFSFSPAGTIPTPTKGDFSATMARLIAAEKQRKGEAEAAN